MLPRDRAYGLATAARDDGTGAGVQPDVWPSSGGQGRTTGAVGRGERPRQAGGQVNGRAGERTGDRLGGSRNRGVAATAAGRLPALAGRPPAAAGDQSVVYERESKNYILYKEKERREKENKANGWVY